MALITLNQVSKIYGSKRNRFNALTNVSLEVESGEFLGIMGPSGAGKSTLLNLASVLDFPTTGRVFLNNQETTTIKDYPLSQIRKKEMGFIFQDFSLLDNLTARENIELPLLAQHVRSRQIRQKIKKVAELLLIAESLDRYPDELSVGQKQRVAAARAIVKDPKIIFADEPTGSLDSKAATELLQFLTEVNQTKKTTIMMVTHDPFTASYCDRIIFIKDGQIFSQINRGNQSRQEFFEKVMNMQAAIGGGQMDVH